MSELCSQVALLHLTDHLLTVLVTCTGVSLLLTGSVTLPHGLLHPHPTVLMTYTGVSLLLTGSIKPSHAPNPTVMMTCAGFSLLLKGSIKPPLGALHPPTIMWHDDL